MVELEGVAAVLGLLGLQEEGQEHHCVRDLHSCLAAQPLLAQCGFAKYDAPLLTRSGCR